MRNETGKPLFLYKIKSASCCTPRRIWRFEVHKAFIFWGNVLNSRSYFAIMYCAWKTNETESRVTLTAAAISDISSPMYSLPVPLNGILVLTMLTNTPILSCCWLILYEPQLQDNLKLNSQRKWKIGYNGLCPMKVKVLTWCVSWRYVWQHLPLAQIVEGYDWQSEKYWCPEPPSKYYKSSNTRQNKYKVHWSGTGLTAQIQIGKSLICGG